MSTQGFPHCPGAWPVLSPPCRQPPSETGSTCRQGRGRRGGSGPPPWHGTSAPGQDNSGSASKQERGRNQCSASPVILGLLGSSPFPVQFIAPGTKSCPFGKHSFISPPIQKNPTNPFSGPLGTLTKSTVQRQRAALEKPNLASDLSPLAPGRPELLPATPGAAAPAQPCELRGKSLPFSCYCKSCFFSPCFPRICR